MKKRIALLVFLLVSIVGLSQEDAIRGNQYELKGSIVNKVELPPHCGIFAWATVIEFKIINFSKPNYQLDTVAVIVCCPEGYGENFFKVGKSYKVSVVDENHSSFEWDIHNKDKLKKYNLSKKLWVTSATKEK